MHNPKIEFTNSRDLVNEVLSYLDHQELTSLEKFDALVDDELFWGDQLTLHFPHYINFAKKKNNCETFFEAYKKEYQDLSIDEKMFYAAVKKRDIGKVIRMQPSQNRVLGDIRYLYKGGIKGPFQRWIDRKKKLFPTYWARNNQLMLDLLYARSLTNKARSEDERDVLPSFHWAILGNQSIKIIEAWLPLLEDVNQNPSPLSLAVIAGREDVIDLLLSNTKINIDSPTVYWDHPLYKAVQEGHLRIVELLLSRKCRIELGDLLHAAAENGDLAMINLLIEKIGVSFKCIYEEANPLAAAIENGHVDIVKILLEKSTNIKEIGCHPINLAAKFGQIEIVKTLLDRGFNLENLDNDGRTPLHFAAQSGHLEVVRLLINKGANVKALSKNQNTLLHFAAQSGSLPLIQFLLKEGIVEVNALSDEKYTPLHIVAKLGYLKIVKLFLGLISPNDIDTLTNWGQTALHLAVKAGHDGVVKKLIESGADVKKVDGEGANPIYLALSHGHPKIVDLLLKNRAQMPNRLYIDKNGLPLKETLSLNEDIPNEWFVDSANFGEVRKHYRNDDLIVWEKRYGVGISSLFKGELEDAILELEKALKHGPYFTLVYTNLALGRAYVAKATDPNNINADNDYELAIQYFDKAFRDAFCPFYSPKITAAMTCGDILANRLSQNSFKGPSKDNDYKNYDIAMDWYKDAGVRACEAKDPRAEECFYKIGRLKYLYGNSKMGKREKDESISRAIQYFSEAIKLNPKNTEYYVSKAKAHHLLSQHEEAIKDYSSAIELNPQYMDCFYKRARLYDQMGQTEKAIQDYTSAINLDPKIYALYYYRAKSYRALGKGRIDSDMYAILDFIEAIKSKVDWEKNLAKGSLEETLKSHGENNIYNAIFELIPNRDDALKLLKECLDEKTLLGQKMSAFLSKKIQGEAPVKALSTYRRILKANLDPSQECLDDKICVGQKMTTFISKAEDNIPLKALLAYRFKVLKTCDSGSNEEFGKKDEEDNSSEHSPQGWLMKEI